MKFDLQDVVFVHHEVVPVFTELLLVPEVLVVVLYFVHFCGECFDDLVDGSVLGLAAAGGDVAFVEVLAVADQGREALRLGINAYLVGVRLEAIIHPQL